MAEVIYPNTTPPFFEEAGLTAAAPSAKEFELRLAGVRAHNRWLAAFCDDLPGRRAGVGQILLNDTDEAVRDVHTIAELGLRGGVLLPGLPPGAAVPPLHAPDHDPVWRACEERKLPVNVHGGGGSPDYGRYPASESMWLMEVAWYSRRPMWSLVFAGVFDRFHELHFVLAEQGSGWIPRTLDMMDDFYSQVGRGGIGSRRMTDTCVLEHAPSDYWRTNCFVAASFLHRDDCINRDAIGTDKIMWGSDYPHLEGTFPYSEAGIRKTFAGVNFADVQMMLAGNAAMVYGFDLVRLKRLAARVGPRVQLVTDGLDEVPMGATSLAFGDRRIADT